MNKLSITRNGTTVTIEQEQAFDADIIVRTIEALDKPVPVPTTPPASPPPSPCPSTPTTPYIQPTPPPYWMPGTILCSDSYMLTHKQIQDMHQNEQLSYTMN